MKNIKYLKSVRDRIPEIIKIDCKIPDLYVAGKKEYWKKLKGKLKEEVDEILEEDNLKDGLANLLEVMHSIAEFQDIDFEEKENIRLNKKEERGVFNKRIILKNVK